MRKNDPQPEMIPQIGPQMMPNVHRKGSRRKTRSGMEFVPRVEVSIFNLNRNKSLLTIFPVFYKDIILRINSSSERLQYSGHNG